MTRRTQILHRNMRNTRVSTRFREEWGIMGAQAESIRSQSREEAGQMGKAWAEQRHIVAEKPCA